MGRGAYGLRWWREVLDHPALRPRARLVAGVLLSYLNADGEAWPSLETIARRAGYSTKKPAREGIEELVEAGFLHIRRGGGRHRTHVYKATFPEPETVSTEPCDGEGTGAERVSPTDETVHSDPETGLPEDPNSEELLENSYAPDLLLESRAQFGVPEGESIGSFLLRTRWAGVLDPNSPDDEHNNGIQT